MADGRWLQINERRTKDGGYVSVGTDITALKHHGEQLMDSERRLMATIADLRRSRQALETQAQQLAELAERHAEKQAEAESANRAKSEFLANMSHELRTPAQCRDRLLGIDGSQQTFGPLGSFQIRGLRGRHQQSSGRYLLAVISDVLEMARLDSGRVQLEQRIVDVGDLVRSSIEEVRAAADGKRIAISSDIQSGSIIHADQRAVTKVLATLLDNAVKFTLDCGHVSVKTRAANGALNMFVKDTGIGIAASALASIGKPFEQAGMTLSNGMKGSGLGLAIARSLIEMHGGSLKIRSIVGVGTIVLARIPASRHWSDPRAGYASQPRAGSARSVVRAVRPRPGDGAPFSDTTQVALAGEPTSATLN